MSKINLSFFLLCSILTACVSSNSHFVRFWNGDVIPERPYEEQKIFESFWNGDVLSDITPEEEKKFDLCYEKTKNLPRGTAEERGKASLATLKCMDDKK